jgi:heme oxygenase (mycobilin-producing)
MAVTLINVFSVHKGKEDEFVRWWEDVKAGITKQPGFISG